MSEKILIIEDEIDVAELLAHHLRAEGFSVEIFNNGRTAFTAVKSQPPALIVLDLMLPEISGFDLCRMIKSNPGTNNVPIVMLSARIEEIDRVLGFELGADDYVVKPFSPRELVLRIRAGEPQPALATPWRPCRRRRSRSRWRAIAARPIPSANR